MKHRRKQCRGGSALEMAMLLPWFIFLFVGAFDWGFYAHALISTEAAARTAVIYASTSKSIANSGSSAVGAVVCTLALEELRIVPNVGTNLTTCAAAPVVTTESFVSSGPDGNYAAKVTVQYTTTSLIPIPGLLENQATFYRVVEMRTRSDS